MDFIQNSFAAGINSVVADTQIPENAYYLLINGRNRFGYVDPVPKHQQFTNTPTGITQGCFGIGNTMLVFIEGKAYYKLLNSTVLIQIANFQLSATAEQVWAESVPASFFNYKRKTDATLGIKGQVIVDTSVNYTIFGNPACVVVNDGITQPQIIMYDETIGIFTARTSKNYSQWKNTPTESNDREYVPIGRQMLYKDGILYMVSDDGKSLYRSVTGRPLDFVINVDENGEKAGDATTTSFAFDFNAITCIAPVTIPNSFIYATKDTTRIITVDFDNTIFGEPTFYTSSIIQAGIIGQYAITDILGDLAFIDSEGVISFDAVKQLRFNGRNSVFSLPLTRFLKDRKQTTSVAFVFNNYAFFNVETTLGSVMAIYDILKECWVSFDITDIDRIKQVALVETVNETQLYCVTWDNKIFQMFSGGDDVYETMLLTRAHAPGETFSEHKATFLRAMFNSPSGNDGYANVTEYVDGKFSQRVRQPLYNSVGGIKYPVIPPIIPNAVSKVDNPSYQLKNGLKGKKISYIISWTKNAQLIEYQFGSQEEVSGSSAKTKSNLASNVYGS